MCAMSALRCALLPLALALAADRERVCAGGPCGEEEASLLQTRRDGAALLQAADAEAMAVNQAPPRKRAVALEGGGFLALTDFTGAVAGLLGGLSNAGRDGSMNELFKSFDTISGISGGGWAQSFLIYSKLYMNMVETAGQQPLTAGGTYKMMLARVLNPFGGNQDDKTMAEGFEHCVSQMTPMLEGMFAAAAANASLVQQEPLGQVDGGEDEVPESAGSSPKQSRADATATPSPSIPTMSPWKIQMASELLILIGTGAPSWTGLVKSLMWRGGGITDDLTLGTSHVNDWARGKTAIWGATAVAPTGEDIFQAEEWRTPLPQVVVFEDANYTVAYTAGPGTPPETAHVKMPVRFSAVIGNGEDQVSPMDFCPGCGNYTLKYTLNGKDIPDVPIRTFNDVFKSAFEDSIGHVPVNGPSAASSAFQGWDGISSKIGAQQGCLALCAWTTDDARGNSFQGALDVKHEVFSLESHEGSIDEIARDFATEGLNPLLDGGYTETTGIAHAVASGADEVLALLDLDLFSGLTDVNFDCIFKGSAYPGSIIFDSPTTEEASSQYLNFNRIHPAEGTARFLQSIAWGTVDAVTTDNPMFGIKGGRKIKINVMAIESVNITIGLQAEGYAYNSFFEYSDLVSEIVMTMWQNPGTQRLIEAFEL